MRSIELQSGEEYVVTLAGRGTAGYRWHAHNGNPAVVAVRSMADSAPSGAAPGVSRDERFAIVAVAPGRAAVHFEQRRPFGPAAPPLATEGIDVHVRA